MGWGKEDFGSGIESGEQFALISAGIDEVAGPLEEGDTGLVIDDLLKGGGVVAEFGLEFLKTRLHDHSVGREGLDESRDCGLGMPVFEFAVRLAELVEDGEVVHTVLELAGPLENGLHGPGFIGGDSDGGEHDAEFGGVLSCVLEPTVSGLASSGSEVGDDDIDAFLVTSLKEFVEGALGMDIEFAGFGVEVLKSTLVGVLDIEVE